MYSSSERAAAAAAAALGGVPAVRELLVGPVLAADVPSSVSGERNVGSIALAAQKELDWLLDDAVGACNPRGAPPCRGWREVQRCARGAAAPCAVALRLDLHGLEDLWRRRLEQRHASRELRALAGASSRGSPAG